MKIRSIYYLAALFLLLGTACEQELLDQEQYRNVLYLKSDGNNIFSYTHQMNDSVSTGYLTVGAGGSLALKEDLPIDIEMDTALLNRYNFRNFGADSAKHVKLVNPKLFVLPSQKIILKKGDLNMTTFFPVEIDANTLSPDSVYMIPFRMNKTAGYEVNPLKEYVFYKPELANKYSSPKFRSYRMKGTRETADKVVAAMTLTKNLLPLGYNKVRLFPDNLSPTTTLADIENKTITLVIDQENQVKVKPYKKVQVEAIGPCSYDPKEKVFTLEYRYRQPGQTGWIKVKEVLTRVE